MADTENAGSNGDAKGEVCIDWMNNVCTRGTRCRFKHQPKDVSKIFERNSVCHDYQNPGGCSRTNCKFLHLSKEDELYIRETGMTPSTLTQDQMERLLCLPPVCNEFLRGECTRGNRCKYRHVSRSDSGPDSYKMREPRSSRYEPYARDGAYPARAPLIPTVREPFESQTSDRMELRRHYQQELLEEENIYLTTQVERLKRQVADLTATNDMLVEQNARLRLTARDSTTLASSLASVVSPAVAVYNPVGSHPVSAQGLPTLSQQVALNSELAQKAALQQRLAQEQSSGAIVATAGSYVAQAPGSNYGLS